MSRDYHRVMAGAADFDSFGGPAFPSEQRYSSETVHVLGMTLRDWFAGQALVGLLASGVAAERGQSSEDVAGAAYANADAMLAERAKP